MYVRGVGPRVGPLLTAKGIETAEDLLYHLPFRYEDRQNPRSVDELKAGEMASVIGEVRGSILLRTRRAPIFELTVGPGLISRGNFTPGRRLRSTDGSSPRAPAAISK